MTGGTVATIEFGEWERMMVRQILSELQTVNVNLETVHNDISDLRVDIIKLGCKEKTEADMKKVFEKMSTMFAGTPFAGMVEKMMAGMGEKHG